MTFDFRHQQVVCLFSEGTQAEAPSSWADRRRRRAVLFEESLAHAAARTLFGAGRALHPCRIADLPFMLALLLRRPKTLCAGLPDPRQAARRPDGFCGLAGDLSAARLMEAYARGLYPKAYAGPLKYWAPAQRMVVDPGNARMPDSLRGQLRRGALEVTFDRDFDAVVAACAKAEETLWRPCWMSPKIKHAYAALHDAGYAHCFEVRQPDGKLVAGGFGVAVGRVFVSESMFGEHRHQRDLGLTVLNRHLALWGFAMHDAKTQVIDDFGFAPIARQTYQEQLATLLGGGRPGRWRVDPALGGAGRPREPAEEFRRGLRVVHSA
jgi:leucyl/phenylalanyl-tRNA--protein transferase